MEKNIDKMNHFEYAKQIIEKWPKWKQEVGIGINKYILEPENSMNELIKKLKKNEKMWSRLSKKERECFIKVGKENCVFWDSVTSKWMDDDSLYTGFWNDLIYRIKENYQPKPTINKYTVVEDGEWLKVRIGNSPHLWSIEDVIGHKDFSHFELDNGHGVVMECISGCMRKGRTVYACLEEN